MENTKFDAQEGYTDFMPVYIHHIETLQPPVSYPQEQIAAVLKKTVAAGDRRMEKIIHHLYAQSGIEKRHSVVADLLLGAPQGIFYDREKEVFLCPSTNARNELYTTAAREMFAKIAIEAFAATPQFAPSDLTHLITVSCTGFFQPGPDFAILKALGLHAGVERYHLGFMGCYAAFPALRMAKAFCEANPDAVVLVVCLELCSLHVQWTSGMDDILAGTVFADGASAAIVSSKKPSGSALKLDAFASAIAPAEDTDMAWTIGDEGFRMRLSSYVPQIIESKVEEAIVPVLTKVGKVARDVDHWAVHPGGRAILDKVEKGLNLPPEALNASREVLRTCGNMSSATILFVLKELMARGVAPEESLLAMSFGPGLTIETAMLSGL
jgi:predicted naringenin-chalcone synthase